MESGFVDVDGNLVSDEDYLGKYVLVYFGFTNCPDICPNELVKIGNIINTLDKNDSTKDKITPSSYLLTLDAIP